MTIIAAQRVERNRVRAKKSGHRWPYATEVRMDADQLAGSLLLAKRDGESVESRVGSVRDLLK